MIQKIIFSLFFCFFILWGQKEMTGIFEIEKIEIKGNASVDENTILLLSGLRIGQKISLPSEEFSLAIRNLWKQDYFSDIAIDLIPSKNQKVVLAIKVKEKPRLSGLKITGVSKSKSNKIKEILNIKNGSLFGEELVYQADQKIKKFYQEKGFLFTKTQLDVLTDSSNLSPINQLKIQIDPGKKVKIDQIIVEGNTHFKTAKIRRNLKDTKQKNWVRFYKRSKYIGEKWEEDKALLIKKYREEGFRNARILSDSIVSIDEKTIRLFLSVEEGEKFFYRNINFVGNTVYSSEKLAQMLGLKTGDLYNQTLLQQRIEYDMKAGNDLTGLYMNNGYLMARVQPVEVFVGKDSVDIEIRIFEGEQFRVGRILINGNDKTKDYVIQRELRTYPGELFSREDIIRTQQELSSKGYFNAEKIGINPIPHPEDNTVDIEYTVEETSSDQIELSVGYGGTGFIASVGLALKNFSIQDIFKKSAWKPLPSGGGQELSLKISATGLQYQNYLLQFMEPWLGGRRPHSLNVNTSYSVSRSLNSKYKEVLQVASTSFGFGQQLKVPDDYFSVYEEIQYQFYNIVNETPEQSSSSLSYFSNYKTGKTHNINATFKIQRRSIDNMIYPRSGSHLMFSSQFTPPYSLFWTDKYTSEIKEKNQYPFAEYYKLKFTAEWFAALSPNQKLVLRLKAGFGFLGYYNAKLGLSPFERFSMGGSGLTGIGQFYYGREIVPLRGYEDEDVSYQNGSAVLAKYILELRYPVIISPSATLYGLVFAEAGNTWMRGKDFNPFDLKKSIGLGVRIFLPIVGMLGLDYGWGIDRVTEFGRTRKAWEGTFNFSLGFQISDF